MKILDLARWSRGRAVSVMMRARPSHLSGLALLLGAMLAVTFFAACGDGPAEPPPDPPRATTITVSPATADLAALGTTVQLSAAVRDQNGQVMAGAAVIWGTSTTAVATVDASGLVTAVANGSATITATSGPVSGGAAVTVAQEVSRVAVTPDTASLGALGDTLRLFAEAFDANGSAVAGAEFSWESSDEAVATVGASGLVTAVANGSATITATSGSVSGSAAVTVAQRVNPDRAALVALYEATDGPNWLNNDNWLTDAPLGEWYGVQTDGSGRVIHLLLSGDYDFQEGISLGNGLRGPIPPELGNLANLTWLSLDTNDLSGPIPPELGKLANLTVLTLGHNALTGPIPPELDTGCPG